MSFDWRHYVEIARKLIAVKADGLEEARFRTAISRCYYGVFSIAREFVESSKPTPLDPKSIHWQVINALESSGHPLEKNIGANLKRLKRQRENCDYEKHCTVRKQDAQQACAVATRVLENLKKAGAV